MVEKFSALRLELGLDNDRKILINPNQLQHDLAICIEGYCNHKRRCSTIDYEQQLIAARTLGSGNPGDQSTESGGNPKRQPVLGIAVPCGSRSPRLPEQTVLQRRRGLVVGSGSCGLA